MISNTKPSSLFDCKVRQGRHAERFAGTVNKTRRRPQPRCAGHPEIMFLNSIVRHPENNFQWSSQSAA